MSLSPFAMGYIIGRSDEGAGTKDISEDILKSDGHNPTVRQVQRIVAHADGIRGREGVRVPGSGRPEVLREPQRKKIVSAVFKYRGSACVTVPFLKKKFVFLRRLGDQTVRDALHDAGLKWLRRRRKVVMKPEYRRERVRFAKWVQAKRANATRNFVYIDGTTFYLARSETQVADAARRRLGPYVWKMSSCKDGLYGDTVGPSLYKCQGRPVKVWGFLCNGFLKIHVLPLNEEGQSTHMNGPTFRDMIDENAADWMAACFPRGRAPQRLHLIQDHERCLWMDESLRTLRRNALDPLVNYPRSSPDLNLIETVWHRLRQTLDMSAPEYIEERADFLARLHGCVRSFNGSKQQELDDLVDTLPKRAAAVLAAKPPRPRTKY